MVHSLYSITELYKEAPIERLLYISSSYYQKDWISLFHSHSFNELLYVLEGEGTFCSEADRIPVKKDSLIIINPNIRHTETSSQLKALHYIVLGIDNLQFAFNRNDAPNGYHIFDMQAHRQTLLTILQSMLQEVRQKNIAYEPICQHYLSILLLHIIRITGNHFSLYTRRSIPEECEYVKQYIDSNYNKEITLTMLSALVHRNKFYLSHIFASAYGISPINYLLERRILHSKELLRNSYYNITEIARISGFSSANYFTQTFKKSTGLTPLNYRRKHHNH